MTKKPKPRQPKIRYQSNDELAEIAHKFLDSNGHLNMVPVDVEAICDKLGVKILSLPRLKKDFGIDSYISDDLMTIVIDNDTFINNECRGRFSLAHELSHRLLHSELYKRYKITNIEEYMQFQNYIGPRIEKRVEAQAYALAGHLLVPNGSFESVLNDELKAIGGTENLSVNTASQLINAICDRFEVSNEVIYRRLKSEYPELIDKILLSQNKF